MAPHLSFSTALQELRARLQDRSPGLVQILSGPRQVGKTTLLLQLAREWGEQAVYAAMDSPEASRPGWWEQLGNSAAQKAASQPALLILDEIQYLEDWGKKLKAWYDRIKKDKVAVRVIASGSSSLLLGRGAREAMTGRFEKTVLAHWTPPDLAEAFSLPRDELVDQAVRWGTYPGGMALRADHQRWRSYVAEAIVEPAIGRDILAMETVLRPALLRQLFMLGVNHPAEIISLQKLQGRLADPGTLETISFYLHLLEEAYLIAALDKFSSRAVRQRAAPPKIVVLNQAFLAALEPPGSEAVETDPARWGRWVENACLARAWNAGQQVLYWRQEPWEVDAVFTGSWGKWAVEVKTGSVSLQDLTGLGQFCKQYPAYQPLILCDASAMETLKPTGAKIMPWREFLWTGLPPV